MSLIILVLLALLCWFWWRVRSTLRYWSRRGVATPVRPWPIVGNLWRRITLQMSFHELQLDLYNKMKGHRYAGFYEGYRPVLMLLDPELIRAVLIKDFEYFTDRPTLNLRNDNYLRHMLISLKGSHWKSVRSVMTPAFSSGKIHAMIPLLRRSAELLVGHLKARDIDKHDTSADLKDLFGRYTMDTIANCAFGVQCDSLSNTDADFIKRAARFNEISLSHRLLIFFVLICCPWLARFIRLDFLNRSTMEFLADVIQTTRKHRAADHTQRRNDFLQLLLDAADRTAMSEEVMVAQALLFLIAGYETSSSVLASAAYELACNPDIQDNARQHIIDNEREADLPYLDAIIYEAMRLHPTVARLDRSVTASYELDSDIGLVLHPKDTVAVNVVGLHMDPQYYPDPNKFDPERFSPEEKAKRSPYVYLPFGAGPRNCIGARFAMLSARIALSQVLREFQFRVCSRTEIPMKLSKRSMLLKAADGMWIDVVPIQQ